MTLNTIYYLLLRAGLGQNVLYGKSNVGLDSRSNSKSAVFLSRKEATNETKRKRELRSLEVVFLALASPKTVLITRM